MSLETTLVATHKRHQELTNMLASGEISGPNFSEAARELAELAPIISAATAVENMRVEISDLEAMISDTTTEDELQELAQLDLEEKQAALPALEQALLLTLVPKDTDEHRGAILEVRAGTGGDEACLFAARLFAMYQRYAQLKNWKWETLDISETDLGGLKEGVASISGNGPFAYLRFESGVHRVQRVPVTESSGRIHTSAATVAVLPEAEDVDIDIDMKDLRIDVYRASGAGGQHVNTTESAVRITHVPTGVTVAIQDEKSQHKNRAKAMKILRARLYEVRRNAANASRAADRKEQIGSGDRSERVRTYNFPQGRVSDHRINLTLYKIESIITGDALDDVTKPLMQWGEAQRLETYMNAHINTGENI